MDDIEKFFDSYENIKSPQSWDNVGTLIDCKNGTTKYMLTIDVTEAVINECIEKNILNIVSYHPFIFSGLKTIPEKYIKVIQNNISVHSVHTRLDYAMCLNIAEILNIEIVSSFDTFIIAQSDVNNLSYYLSKCKSYIAEPGMRYVISNVHGYESTFDTLIIGVGSAQKEFMKHAKNSLIITGEMSHHDMLYYRDNGCSVILMEHSNIERIYLQVLHDKMLNAGFDVTVSRFDADPVKIYVENKQ